MPKEKVHDLYLSAPGFLEYEKGRMDDKRFRDYVRATYAISASDRDIDNAWIAMLRGIPPLKLELLKKLQSEFQVFLLSNTNNIHLHHINESMLPEEGRGSLDNYFHKAYYSHKMGKRNPAAVAEIKVMTNKATCKRMRFLSCLCMEIMQYQVW